jgi:hypothetical protein
MRYETQRQYQEHVNKCMSCSTLEGFKQHLIDKYGSITSGWRSVLDTAGNGKLSFLEFGQSLRELPFQGSAKELFSELGGDQRGFITLDTLDPEAAQTITLLRELLLSRFECMVDAWNDYIDDAGNIWLDEEEFLHKISGIGYDYGGAKKGHLLFRAFMPNIYSQHLHLDDLKVLLIGIPRKEERKKAWAGEAKPPPPVVRTTRPNSANATAGNVRSRPNSPSSTKKQLPKARAKGASRPSSALSATAGASRPSSALGEGSKGLSRPSSAMSALGESGKGGGSRPSSALSALGENSKGGVSRPSPYLEKM